MPDVKASDIKPKTLFPGNFLELYQEGHLYIISRWNLGQIYVCDPSFLQSFKVHIMTIILVFCRNLVWNSNSMFAVLNCDNPMAAINVDFCSIVELAPHVPVFYGLTSGIGIWHPMSQWGQAIKG